MKKTTISKIFLIMIMQTAVFGSTYYLSTIGSNVNNGSKEAPFGTINYAASALKAGDTLLIRAGTYYPTEPVRPGPKNGANSESERITVKAYPGEEVWIDGSNLPSDTVDAIISIDNYRSFITIDGLKIKNNTEIDTSIDNRGKGISVHYYSTNAIIRNCYITNTGSSGIKLSSTSNCIIENNEIYQCCRRGVDESMSVITSNNIIIRNNEVHEGGGPNQYAGGEINGIGIDIKNGCTNINVYGNHVHHNLTNGIYVDALGYTDNLQIYNNYIHDNESHGLKLGNETDIGYIHNSNVYNNIIVRNMVGITVGQDHMPPNNLKHINIVNNVLIDNEHSGMWLMTQSDETRYPGVQAEDILIANNIIMGNPTQLQSYGDNIHLDEYTIDNNIIIGLTNNVGQTNTITEDPLFKNISVDNFHLMPGSSAIGKAKNNQANAFKPTFDYDGVIRGTPYDIGVFGFSGTNNGRANTFILNSIDKTLRALDEK